jgi:hypothetical protein
MPRPVLGVDVAPTTIPHVVDADVSHLLMDPMYVGAGYQPALGIVEKSMRFGVPGVVGLEGGMRRFRAGY